MLVRSCDGIFGSISVSLCVVTTNIAGEKHGRNYSAWGPGQSYSKGSCAETFGVKNPLGIQMYIAPVTS